MPTWEAALARDKVAGLVFRPISRLYQHPNLDAAASSSQLLGQNWVGWFKDRRVEDQYLVDLYVSRATVEVSVLVAVILAFIALMAFHTAETAVPGPPDYIGFPLYCGTIILISLYLLWMRLRHRALQKKWYTLTPEPGQSSQTDLSSMWWVTSGLHAGSTAVLCFLAALYLTYFDDLICYNSPTVNKWAACRTRGVSLSAGAALICVLAAGMFVVFFTERLIFSLVVVCACFVATLIGAFAPPNGGSTTTAESIVINVTLFALCWIGELFICIYVDRRLRSQFTLVASLEIRQEERLQFLEKELATIRALGRAKEIAIRAESERRVHEAASAFVAHLLRNPLHQVSNLVAGLLSRSESNVLRRRRGAETAGSSFAMSRTGGAKEPGVGPLTWRAGTPASSGAADLSEEEVPLPADVILDLRAIDAATRTMDVVVADMLIYQRLLSGEVDIRPFQVDLRSLLNQLAQYYSSEAEFPVSLQIMKAVPHVLTCDGVRVTQVMHHVYSQALRVTGVPVLRHGTVTRNEDALRVQALASETAGMKPERVSVTVMVIGEAVSGGSGGVAADGVSPCSSSAAQTQTPWPARVGNKPTPEDAAASPFLALSSLERALQHATAEDRAMSQSTSGPPLPTEGGGTASNITPPSTAEISPTAFITHVVTAPPVGHVSVSVGQPNISEVESPMGMTPGAPDIDTTAHVPLQTLTHATTHPPTHRLSSATTPGIAASAQIHGTSQQAVQEPSPGGAAGLEGRHELTPGSGQEGPEGGPAVRLHPAMPPLGRVVRITVRATYVVKRRVVSVDAESIASGQLSPGGHTRTSQASRSGDSAASLEPPAPSPGPQSKPLTHTAAEAAAGVGATTDSPPAAGASGGGAGGAAHPYPPTSLPEHPPPTVARSTREGRGAASPTPTSSFTPTSDGGRGEGQAGTAATTVTARLRQQDEAMAGLGGRISKLLATRMGGDYFESVEELVLGGRAEAAASPTLHSPVPRAPTAAPTATPTAGPTDFSVRPLRGMLRVPIYTPPSEHEQEQQEQHQQQRVSTSTPRQSAGSATQGEVVAIPAEAGGGGVFDARTTGASSPANGLRIRTPREEEQRRDRDPRRTPPLGRPAAGIDSSEAAPLRSALQQQQLQQRTGDGRDHSASEVGPNHTAVPIASGKITPPATGQQQPEQQHQQQQQQASAVVPSYAATHSAGSGEGAGGGGEQRPTTSRDGSAAPQQHTSTAPPLVSSAEPTFVQIVLSWTLELPHRIEQLPVLTQSEVGAVIQSTGSSRWPTSRLPLQPPSVPGLAHSRRGSEFEISGSPGATLPSGSPPESDVVTVSASEPVVRKAHARGSDTIPTRPHSPARPHSPLLPSLHRLALGHGVARSEGGGAGHEGITGATPRRGFAAIADLSPRAREQASRSLQQQGAGETSSEAGSIRSAETTMESTRTTQSRAADLLTGFGATSPSAATETAGVPTDSDVTARLAALALIGGQPRTARDLPMQPAHPPLAFPFAQQPQTTSRGPGVLSTGALGAPVPPGSLLEGAGPSQGMGHAMYSAALPGASIAVPRGLTSAASSFHSGGDAPPTIYSSPPGSGYSSSSSSVGQGGGGGALPPLRIRQPAPSTHEQQEHHDEAHMHADMPYDSYTLTPKAQSAAVATAAGSGEAVATLPPLGLHVLVCDDDAVNRRLHARMLQRIGCTSALATDGDEIETVLKSELTAGRPVDVMLLDILMPRLAGDRALLLLRQKGDTTPAIAATGNVYFGEHERYLAIGFDAVLKKAFTLRQLHATLIDALARHRARMEGGEGHGQP